MIFLQELLPIIIYFLLIILLIVGIILFIKAISALSKVEKVVDDVNQKVQSLNGFFSVIDFATDKIVSVSDRLIEFIFNSFSKLFKKSKKKNIEKEEEDKNE